jgi:hypothetical protein
MRETIMRIAAPVRRRARVFWALAGVLALIALSGCSGGSGSGVAAGSKDATVNAPLGVGAPSTGVEGLYTQIPAGTAFAEGGVTRYTFREEWRRALADAQKWNVDAYLVRATGDGVDASGVPAAWRLDFADAAVGQSVLSLTIDATGKVTASTETTGAAAKSVLGKRAARIPPNIMDSDRAAKFGRQALGLTAASTTTDPRLILAFDPLDGTGPDWTFSVLDPATGKRASARIDAITGAVSVRK